ncbi:MAG: hypothetical protein H7X89_11675 [Rhizobiales bacterium]|nr:hypothetical protein [Hyphomicrobiales bacterium]
MHYLIGLLIAAIVSLSQAEAASIKRSTSVVIAPQVIVVAKPKPNKPKAQPQQYLIIKLNDALITSY